MFLVYGTDRGATLPALGAGKQRRSAAMKIRLKETQFPFSVQNPGRRRLGFTLIELLVVIAIISLLVAIMVPTLYRAKLLAMRVTCEANLHAVGLAAHQYMADFNEYVPICLENIDPSFPGVKNPWKTWRVNLLPYVPGVSAFNCPSAKDTGVIGDVIHSFDEITSLDLSGTANAGSYGVIIQYALPSFQTVDYNGQTYTGHPATSDAFPTAPGAAWMNPANSIYIADGYLSKGGPFTYPSQSYKGYGSSGIFRPSDPEYNDPSVRGVCRRFADRHCGTNCLFLDGRVQGYETQALEEMKLGDGACVWDTN